MGQEIHIIRKDHEAMFEEEVNEYLGKGWEVLHVDCKFGKLVGGYIVTYLVAVLLKKN